jgi:pimeloyl-ACP methyl ester carboxylesterase
VSTAKTTEKIQLKRKVMTDTSDFKQGSFHTNGIELHYAEYGEGPLVILCHGWPESWYSWRHQIRAIGENGYRAVALHMRGYGRSTRPENIEEYGLGSLVGDVVGSVDGLGASEAVVIGHDWGGPVAWYSALMRPDLFKAVAVLSVPFMPPFALPADVSMNQIMTANADDRQYYRLFFQEPGVAEADFEKDVRRSMLGVLYSISGDIVEEGVHSAGWDGHFSMQQSMTDQFVIPEVLPAWLREEDLDFYVNEHSSTGFTGGFNWYRNIHRLPRFVAPFIGKTIDQPSLYLYGQHDLIAGNTVDNIASMKTALTDMRGCIKFSGAGHWLQQERAEEVNEALLKFLGNI